MLFLNLLSIKNNDLKNPVVLVAKPFGYFRVNLPDHVSITCQTALTTFTLVTQKTDRCVILDRFP